MNTEPLEKDAYYHIYNRGINGAIIFRNDLNKNYFLKLAHKYLSRKVAVLAYCLMDNHYHMLVRIESDAKVVSQSFSNLFNAYAKAFNKQERRSGTLFERPFKRKRIKDDDYLRNLIVYIHTNPETHGVSDDFRTFEFSSYPIFNTSNQASDLEIEKEEVISLFDDYENMDIVHRQSLGKKIQDAGLDLSGLPAEQKRPIEIPKPDKYNLPTPTKNLTGLSQKQPWDVTASFDHTVKSKFYNYIQDLQNTITTKLEEVDGKATFREDVWERPEGGGGRSRVIENGKVFEKGGVNISAVHGELPKSMQAYFGVEDADYFACGLSLVLHPKNPMVPTVHANWRYFEMYDKKGTIVDQWFGGGQDLTPYYLFDDDAIHFHSVCKAACDKHHQEFYTLYKKRCDEYFWNAHRNEARGIGGLFFDYCKATEAMKMTDWYDFVTEVGDSFLDSYIPIVFKRKHLDYTSDERDWQEIRRGRYVEFNLVHDKGTLFGLKTNGRIESILMSLPPFVQWRYDHQVTRGSEEEKLLDVLKNPKEWV